MTHMASQISEKDAIKIAKKEVNELGYNSFFMRIKISFHTTPWNDCLPKERMSNFYLEKRNLLKNRNYWAVYFGPIAIAHKGGDVCIFIDANTGEVITVVGGK